LGGAPVGGLRVEVVADPGRHAPGRSGRQRGCLLGEQLVRAGVQHLGGDVPRDVDQGGRVLERHVAPLVSLRDERQPLQSRRDPHLATRVA
jgi:hypothetical protein